MSQQDPVKTAARTLDVFEEFARAKGPLTLTELANRIGSPLSSLHALVRTLQARGFVHILDERKRVYPTKRLLSIAQQIATNDPVLEHISPILATLQKDTGETVILGKRQGRAIIYLDVIEGRNTIRYSADPGDTKPLHSSAIGKAMLGILTDAELTKLVNDIALKQVTANTISEPAALSANIRAGRERGYFVTSGENVPEVMGVAIARKVGEEAYGVAVAGPIGRLEAKMDVIVAALMKAGSSLIRIDAELSGKI